MTNNLDKLRQVAANATPGPWAVYDRGIGYEVHDANGYELNGGMRETFTEADATHIATFDPPTALALIDRAERAEQAVQRVREAALEMANHPMPDAPKGSAWLLAEGAQLFAKDVLEALDGVEQPCSECQGSGDVQVRFAHGIQTQDCGVCFGPGDQQ